MLSMRTVLSIYEQAELPQTLDRSDDREGFVSMRSYKAMNSDCVIL